MDDPKKRKQKVEFIESYWTGGEFGNDYQWNDNHGELIRCKDCDEQECNGRNGSIVCGITGEQHPSDWFCADGRKKDDRA